MILNVDHIDLKVPDLEASVAFFTTLGMVVIRRTESPRHSVEMALPGDQQVLFELRENKASEQTTIDHIAFAVDDTVSTLEHLKAAGIGFNRENHLVADTGRYVSNFKDPHGGKWQLSE